MKNTDYLINLYVYPLLEEECKRLKVPREFVLGVYSCYCKDSVSGYVEKVQREDKLVGVRVRIGECNQNRLSVLNVFFHEMHHVKEEWEGRKRFLSELRADLYAWSRIFQLMLGEMIYRLKTKLKL